MIAEFGPLFPTSTDGLSVRGPFGLEAHVRLFRPGTRLTVDGAPQQIAGTVVASDEVETWLECLLVGGGPPQHWLAVEARDGAAVVTRWRRRRLSELDLDIDAGLLDGSPLTPTEEGLASYGASGSFGDTALPAEGTLRYQEFTHRSGRVACTRFADHLPWWAGSGTGRPVSVKVVDS